MNLYEVIKRNGYHGFSLSVVQKYAFSLVQCLRLLYREKIIHCDLKPVRDRFALLGGTGYVSTVCRIFRYCLIRVLHI